VNARPGITYCVRCDKPRAACICTPRCHLCPSRTDGRWVTAQGPVCSRCRRLTSVAREARRIGGPRRRTEARDRAMRLALVLAFIPDGAEYDGLRDVARRHIGRREAA
jgi:hypothetical protein